MTNVSANLVTQRLNTQNLLLVDTNSVTTLAVSAMRSGLNVAQTLDTLLGTGRRLVLTSQVYEELNRIYRNDGSEIAENVAISSWLASRSQNYDIAPSSNRFDVRDGGEQSVFEFVKQYGAKYDIIMVSDDARYKIFAESFLNSTAKAVPGSSSPTLSTVDFINGLLGGGAISPRDFNGIADAIRASGRLTTTGPVGTDGFIVPGTLYTLYGAGGIPVGEVRYADGYLQFSYLYNSNSGTMIDVRIGSYVDAVGLVDGNVVYNPSLKNPGEQIDDTVRVKCFLAGTRIADEIGTVAVENVRPGNYVLAYDSKIPFSQLSSRKVTRIFRNNARSVIDIRGVLSTLSHSFLDGEGEFKDIGRILLDDLTIVDQHGIIIRARTGAPVGSLSDALIKITSSDSMCDDLTSMVVRAGVPCASLKDSVLKAECLSLIDVLEIHHIKMDAAGVLSGPDGHTVSSVELPGAFLSQIYKTQQNWVTEAYMHSGRRVSTLDWIQVLKSAAISM